MKYVLLTPSIGISKGGIQAWSYYIVELLKYYNMPVDYASLLENKLSGLVKMIYWNFSAKIFILTIWHMFFFVIFAFVLSQLNLRSCSFIILIHGDEILKLGSIRRKLLLQIFKKKNVYIIANSLATSELFYKKSGIKTQKVLYPFIKIDTNIHIKEKKEEIYNLLTLTRLVKRKNIKSVLYALKMLKNKGLKFNYYIAGAGSEYESLVSLTRGLNLEENVSFLGRVYEEQKRQLYLWADLFILPSVEMEKSIEGYGIVFIEANSFGIPVISGNTGGMKEAVINGVTGFHTDGSPDEIAEKIAIALKTNFDRRKIVEHAKKHDYKQQEDFLKFINSWG